MLQFHTQQVDRLTKVGEHQQDKIMPGVTSHAQTLMHKAPVQALHH